MTGEIDILVPEYTKNLILNPGMENNLDNWVPAWNQEATFEDQELTPNPTGFDSISGATTSLDVTALAAIRGNYGYQVDIIAPAPNTGDAYGTFTDPDSEDEVVVEFYIDTNNFAPDAVNFIVIADAPAAGGGSAQAFRVTFISGDIRYIAYNDAGAAVASGTIVSTALQSVYKIRVHWKAATAPAANDGFIRTYVNDALAAESTGIDNDLYRITDVNFGLVDVFNSPAGTIFMDNCRWANTDVPFTGCSIERTLERARFGRYSTRVITDGYSVNEGIYTRVDTTSIQGMVTGSAYVRGNGQIRIRLEDGLNGNQFYSDVIALQDEYWQRIQVQGTAYASDDYQLHIETAGSVAQEATFYVDAVQLEQTDEMTSYVDGTQPGCRWNGVAFKSTSERLATEPNGGRWVSLKEDPCDPDTYFTAMFGFGMPPVTINRQRMAQAPGSFFDSERVEERPFGMTVIVKDDGAKKRTQAQIEKIWGLRQRIEDLVKPDRDPNNEPMWLRYRQGDRFLMIRAHYESGLNFDGDVRNKYFNVIPLRFLALDPFWYEDSQEVALLDTEKPLDDVFLAAARVDGEWQEVAQLFGDTAGDTDFILAIEEDANGRIYYGGSFTLDGDGNPMLRFAYLNDDYTELIEGGTGFDARVRDIKAHPNGKVYVCGDFTFDGGGVQALNYIAEYDPVTNTFAAMGAGLDDEAYEMAIAPNGDVYVVGLFSTAGGVAVYRIARWDGGAWHRVGDLDVDLGLVGANLFTIIMRDTDDIYIGGTMTPGAGGSIKNASYDGSTWTEMGDSETAQDNGVTQVIRFDNDNTIIIGYSGGVHRWNGSGYVAMGDGLSESSGATASVHAIAVAPDGNIYAGGSFNQSGDIVINRNIAIYNGSSWTNFDFDLTVTRVSAILARQNGDVYAGFTTANPALDVEAVGSGIIEIECKSTTETFIIVSFEGTGRILWLENQSAGVVSFFDYTLQEDELLEVNYETGIKSVESNYRGSVPDAILPNSEDIFLRAGKLDVPSTNRMACLIIDEVEPTVQVRYTPTHWSIDAISAL